MIHSRVLLGVGRRARVRLELRSVLKDQGFAILRSPIEVDSGLSFQFGVSEFDVDLAHVLHGLMLRLRDVLQQVMEKFVLKTKCLGESRAR